MPHPVQVEPLEEGECLEKDRPLAPETGLEDFEGAVSGPEGKMRWALNATLITSEVFGSEQTCGLLHRLGDALSDISSVEAIASSIDGGLAPLWEIPLLLLG
jgi:hypothetical protein